MSSHPLLSRFARWAEEGPDAPALGLPRSRPDGGCAVDWTPRRDLLAAVRAEIAAAGATGHPTGRGSTGPMVVDPEDPCAAVVGLMAAEQLGRAVVVRAPDWDEAAVSGIVAALAERCEDGAGLLVLPTSGTRGRPRAVVRTSRSWAASLLPFSRLTGITAMAAGRDGFVWAPGGLGSTLTLWAVWHALASGVPVAATGPWHPSRARVLASGDPDARGPFWLQAVPAIAEDVLDDVRRGHVTSPAGVIVAGAAVSDALESGWRGLGVPVTTYYGAAELSFVAARRSDACSPDTAGGDAGLRPFPGVAVALRDGEIWARSRYTALGYLGAPGAGSWRDGWVSVHDRGTMTPDGALRVLGRGDAGILVGATTVLAADVEDALGAVAGVAEIVCLPEPDPRLGQRIVAFVRPAGPPDHAAVASPAAPSDHAAPPGRAGHDAHLITRLREAARQRLAAPSRPSRYVLRADFPRTPAGKVAREKLGRDLARDSTRDPAPDPARGSR